MKTGYQILLSLIFVLPTVAFAEERPNILFIAIDDCKPMLGCYGNTAIKTPNMDRIASQGVTFLNNHCQWAVCGPSRASISSGMMPETVGVMGFTPMRAKLPDLITLQQQFRLNGYETGARGKINDNRCVGKIVNPKGKTQGGSKTDDPPSWSVPYQSVPSGYQSKKERWVVDGNGKDETEFTDWKICDQGIELMQKMAKGDKPFFLCVGFKKPHLPFVAPKKYWDLYSRDQFKIHPFQEMPKNVSKYTFNTIYETRTYNGVPKTGPFPEPLQKELIHGYYACVSFIDALVGRLQGELKTLGKDQNTIIIIWGDHGFHLGDHAEWGKHTNIEQATRSPLIIAGPMVSKKGLKTNAPSMFLDIYPTLCEMAGLPIPKTVQGRSMTPILSGESEKLRNGAISLFRNQGAIGYAYRTERYRYIEWCSQEQKTVVARELYDYEKDPMETVNIIGEKGMEPLVARLAEQLREEAVGCPLLKACSPK